jgi:hypothetical protein
MKKFLYLTTANLLLAFSTLYAQNATDINGIWRTFDSKVVYNMNYTNGGFVITYLDSAVYNDKISAGYSCNTAYYYNFTAPRHLFKTYSSGQWTGLVAWTCWPGTGTCYRYFKTSVYTLNSTKDTMQIVNGASDSCLAGEGPVITYLVKGAPSGVNTMPDKLLSVMSYPNPAIDKIAIDIVLKKADRFFVELYAANGQLIRKQDFGTVSDGRNVLTLDVADIPSGYYFYRLYSNTDTYRHAFLKQ